MERKILVKFVGLGEGSYSATMPEYSSEKAAGLDLYSAHDVCLEPGIPHIVHTGIAMEIVPAKKAETSRDIHGRFCTVMVNDDMMIQIVPRSDLALKDGVTVLNAPSIIDEDYREEVCVILVWTGADTTLNNFEIKTDKDGEKYLYIPAKTRIAQAVLTPVYHPILEKVETISETERGDNEFGSTDAPSKKTKKTATKKTSVNKTTVKKTTTKKEVKKTVEKKPVEKKTPVKKTTAKKNTSSKKKEETK